MAVSGPGVAVYSRDDDVEKSILQCLCIMHGRAGACGGRGGEKGEIPNEHLSATTEGRESAQMAHMRLESLVKNERVLIWALNVVSKRKQGEILRGFQGAAMAVELNSVVELYALNVVEFWIRYRWNVLNGEERRTIWGTVLEAVEVVLHRQVEARECPVQIEKKIVSVFSALGTYTEFQSDMMEKVESVLLEGVQEATGGVASTKSFLTGLDVLSQFLEAHGVFCQPLANNSRGLVRHLFLDSSCTANEDRNTQILPYMSCCCAGAVC